MNCLSFEDFLDRTMAGIGPQAVRGILRLETIKDVLSFVTDDERFVSVLLGGSYANHRARNYSDVDVYAFVVNEHIRWRRQFEVIQGVPVELNVLSISFLDQIMKNAQTTRYAAILRALSETMILKGEELSLSIRHRVNSILEDHIGGAPGVERLSRKLRFSLTTKLIDFHQEPESLKAHIILCSMVGDVSSLLNLVAQGWVSNSKHMVVGINQDQRCVSLLNQLFECYTSYICAGDKAAITDTLVLILTACGGGVWSGFEESF
ncbi:MULTISPECIES: nucleotidyltransferase domain-containing protein [unclassified Pseudomonas]|uniref:nucleotidyltransferase domain-containing protein n=1 Tax=unclassified Pseudomonas TaxID=196821 RepID=UPI0011AF2BD2|nr:MULTISPECIES: nucleotidyltransferase domain-containing protein [unclassified Pseudomonas]